MATSTTKAADNKAADKTTKAAEVKAVKTEAKKEVKAEAKKDVKAEAKKETAPKAETTKKTVAPKAAAKKVAAPKAAAKKTCATKKAAPKKNAAPKAVEATFDSIYAAVNAKAKKAKFTSNFIATQITLTGNVESQPLYVKVEDKKVEVAPYNYNDSTFVINADAETMAAVLNDKKCIYEAIAEGKIAVYGDASMAILFFKAMF